MLPELIGPGICRRSASGQLARTTLPFAAHTEGDLRPRLNGNGKGRSATTTRALIVPTRPLLIALTALIMLLPRPEAAVAQESTGTPQATPGAVLSATSAITTITLGDEVTIDGEGAAVSELGVVIATGARLSVPVATSAQASVVVTFGAPQAADTLVVIRNQDGEDVLVFAPAIAYQQLLYSDAGLADDVTYTVYSGGEGEAGDGRFTAPVMNPGTEVTTITTESVEEARLRRPGGPPPGEGGPPPDAAAPTDERANGQWLAGFA